MPKIFAICGSLRRDSFNRKLLALAVAELTGKGATLDVYDLKTDPLPFYDGDVELAGYPEAALALKRRIDAADGLLIATPEYNHGLPAPLKNAIDWASRPTAEPKNPFKGKLVANIGATPGMGGTVYSQMVLRETMYTLGAWCVPGQFTLSGAAEQLKDGALVDSRRKDQLSAYLGAFLGELPK
jgi:chromate reductase, NAD(P)H dehydrogenase (quinone)